MTDAGHLDESSLSIKELMTRVIGSGPKTADDMTYEQAYNAMRDVMDKRPDRLTVGAFWLANRWKTNTPEELAGFLDAMKEEMKAGSTDISAVDCGANYDGKLSTALLGVPAGLVAAAGGVPIVVHSGDRVPTKKGATYRHVLRELGVETELEPGKSAGMLEETGLGFYNQRLFNPGVHGLLDWRDLMGVRTYINTIETLANPADTDTHIGSFYHLSFAKRIIDTVRTSNRVDFNRVLMFQGLEGYDDVRPGYTKVAEWSADEGLSDYEVETEEFNLDIDGEDLEVSDVTVDTAELTMDVLRGDRDDYFRDAVALNASLRLYAGGEADSIEEGFVTALDVIESGDALDVLDSLRGCTF